MKQTTYTLLFIFFLTLSAGKTIAENPKATNAFPPPTPCGTVTNITVDSVNSSVAEITWDAVPGAIKYNVGRRPVGDLVWGYQGTDTNYVKLRSLDAGTEYEFIVTTWCDVSAGYAKRSGSVSGQNFTTLSTCPAPDKLFTNNITTNSALATWITTPNSSQYRIRIRPVGSMTWTVYIVFGGNKNKFSLTGLNHSTDYEWQLRSGCGSYNDLSAWSLPEYFSTKCEQPNDVEVENITSSSALVDWDDNDGAYKYRLRRRAVGDVDWVYSSVLAPGNERKFTNLLPGTEYEFQVQTYCDSSLNDSSDYVSGSNFTTLNDCISPDGRITTDITDVSAKANWNVAANSSGYRVRIRQVGDVSWNFTVIKGGNTTSHTFTGLNPSTDYEWQVRTICNSISDYSGFDSTQTFTTSAASRLESPATVTANQQTDGQIYLYPNPSNGQFAIEMNTGCNCSEAVSVEVLNTLGQNVYTGKLTTANGYVNERISLNGNIPNGVYLIRVVQENHSFESHFILYR